MTRKQIDRLCIRLDRWSSLDTGVRIIKTLLHKHWNTITGQDQWMMIMMMVLFTDDDDGRFMIFLIHSNQTNRTFPTSLLVVVVNERFDNRENEIRKGNCFLWEMLVTGSHETIWGGWTNIEWYKHKARTIHPAMITRGWVVVCNQQYWIGQVNNTGVLLEVVESAKQ